MQESYIFLDVIMDEVIKHENYINKINSKSFDKLSNSILKGCSKKKIYNDSDFLNELNSFIFDITNFFQGINNTNSIEKNFKEIEELNNDNNNLEDNSKSKIKEKKSGITNINVNKKIYWLINDFLSCFFDSFYSIFIVSIISIIKSTDEILSILNKNKDNIYYINFNHILEFCGIISQSINNNFIKFYDIYLNYQKVISNNILLIKEDEIGSFNPITICYRLSIILVYSNLNIY